MNYFLPLFLILISSTIFGKTQFGVWSEWTEFKDLPQKYEYLKKSGARLHLAIKKDELTEENFQSLVIA